MAALNLPLITWCIIVAAMTVLISVRLFHKSCNPAHNHKLVTKRDKVMKHVDY